MDKAEFLRIVLVGAALFAFIVVLVSTFIAGYIVRDTDEEGYVRHAIGMTLTKLGKFNGVALLGVGLFFFVRYTLSDVKDITDSPILFYGLLASYLGIIIGLTLPSVVGAIMVASLKDEIIERQVIDEADDRRTATANRRDQAADTRAEVADDRDKEANRRDDQIYSREKDLSDSEVDNREESV